MSAWREKIGARERINVELVLPVEAVQFLYEALGHFPHDPCSWSTVARGNCSVGLWDAKSVADQRETNEGFVGDSGVLAQDAADVIACSLDQREGQR